VTVPAATTWADWSGFDQLSIVRRVLFCPVIIIEDLAASQSRRRRPAVNRGKCQVHISLLTDHWCQRLEDRSYWWHKSISIVGRSEADESVVKSKHDPEQDYYSVLPELFCLAVLGLVWHWSQPPVVEWNQRLAMWFVHTQISWHGTVEQLSIPLRAAKAFGATSLLLLGLRLSAADGGRGSSIGCSIMACGVWIDQRQWEIIRSDHSLHRRDVNGDYRGADVLWSDEPSRSITQDAGR
jgi:hypothetical protein